MIELRTDVNLKDTIVVAIPKLVGEGFYMLTITARGVPVGLKVGFKPRQKFRPVINKNNNASTSGKKKQDAVPSKEVSNSNSFDILNSVENDVDLGTNEGTSNVAGKGVNSGGSPSNHGFFNVEPCSTSTTHVVERIDKLERLIINGKVTLVDDDGKSFKKIVC
ncbi:hypothetical protein Tco_0676848 [Tanacetum coccineum]